MLERLSGALSRGIHTSVCRTLDLHTPDAQLKSNGVFFYGRCSFCGTVITRTGSTTWRSAGDIDAGYLAEMRDVSSEFLRVAQE